jgi:translation initiation factor IF-1
MLFDIMSPIVMSNSKGETKIGVVVENLPNTMFRVQFEGEEQLHLSYLAGKMKLYRIRILVGDKVEVLIDPYGGKGRIIKRL